MHYKQDPDTLEVYLETRKRRVLAGILFHNREKNYFEFIYEKSFLYSKSAIPVGVELSLARIQHTSVEGNLFPTFLDRIPSKRNPAYVDYCRAQGISPDENNEIVLLTTIGRRGPSSFIYEPVFFPVGSVSEELKKFRTELLLSRWDVARIFDISELTLLKIENEKCFDKNILHLLHYFLTEPHMALRQLELTGKKVHRDTRTRVYRYFMSRA